TWTRGGPQCRLARVCPEYAGIGAGILWCRCPLESVPPPMAVIQNQPRHECRGCWLRACATTACVAQRPRGGASSPACKPAVKPASEQDSLPHTFLRGPGSVVTISLTHAATRPPAADARRLGPPRSRRRALLRRLRPAPAERRRILWHSGRGPGALRHPN